MIGHEPTMLVELVETTPDLTDFRCSYCGAAPGHRCTVKGTSRPISVYSIEHDARWVRRGAYVDGFRAGYAAALADMQRSMADLTERAGKGRS